MASRSSNLHGGGGGGSGGRGGGGATPNRSSNLHGGGAMLNRSNNLQGGEAMPNRSNNFHGGGDGGENYGNLCLTMHQPWASLLVCGIKRIEGRSWPTPLRGRLWIHAAGKVPDQATIKAMEDFYREIYALDGVTDLKFPESYPVSRLLGCIDVVGCLKGRELSSWEEVPEGVRLEALTDYCWLCEQPQKLMVPFEMRGYQGVYNLERKVYEAAVRGLCPVEPPMPIKFPLPDLQDAFSLKPGSVRSIRAYEVEKSEPLSRAIAGARAAATQFSKKSNGQSSARVRMYSPVSTRTGDQVRSDTMWYNRGIKSGQAADWSNV